MIRLEKHDDLLEAMAEAISQRCVMTKAASNSFATAALDALLAAAVEKGVGKAIEWDFPCLILKLEPKP